MTELLNNVFPPESDIPNQFKIERALEQREYLIDGEMKTWAGNLNPVLSPVCISAGKSVVKVSFRG